MTVDPCNRTLFKCEIIDMLSFSPFTLHICILVSGNSYFELKRHVFYCLTRLSAGTQPLRGGAPWHCSVRARRARLCGRARIASFYITENKKHRFLQLWKYVMGLGLILKKLVRNNLFSNTDYYSNFYNQVANTEPKHRLIINQT